MTDQHPAQDNDVLFEPENPLPDFYFEHLPEDMQKRVAALGWETPTPVQRKAIPYILAHRDIIVQARTGSGKTAAYLLPIIQNVVLRHHWCQALILAPTRELARQVHTVLLELTEGTAIKTAILYGGVSYGNQLKDLKDGAQIVVGTPGRILDHVYRGTLTLMQLQTLIFDEADEMLSMGFYPSMRKLKRQIPVKRSTYMFSATIPYHVEQLAHEFLHHPDRLSLSKGTQSVTELEHRYYIAQSLQKDRALIRILEYENPESAIIFTNTKRNAEYLSAFLKNYGIDAQHLTGDLPQGKRERVMNRLRSGELRFLIATDVAARGIDISDLSYVILYDIPEHVEVYVHRSGRTARAGKTGTAVTLCEKIEESKLLGIAKRYGFTVEKYELPTDEEIQQRLSERIIVRLEDQLNDMAMMDRERVQRFLPIVEQLTEDAEMHILLAMLLDQSYQSGLVERLYDGPVHTPASKGAEGKSETSEEESAKKKKRQRSGKRKKSSDEPAEKT
ncbi:MAG: DEAD/DEAH box helicase [Bacteroidetes bacterium]|nr:DEAD/DEAH box helicase [Bacteroidota bacterium]